MKHVPIRFAGVIASPGGPKGICCFSFSKACVSAKLYYARPPIAVKCKYHLVTARSMSTDSKVSSLDPRGLLKYLQETSPTFRDYKPLALRIDVGIRERFPDFERKTLRSALHLHTSSTRYLKSVERGRERFDLDGNVAGEVTEEQRAYATAKLKERFAATAKRQKEKRQAEEAERRREEKMRKLIDRFARER